MSAILNGYPVFTSERLYRCEICHHINHVARLHCSACGTIPRQYSPIAKPAVTATSLETYIVWNNTNPVIEVHNAIGCERSNQFRTVKSNLRTVPMDYYAEGK